MSKEEIVDREISRVREILEVIASEEVLDLVNELELLLYQRQQIEEENRYGNK